MDQPPTNRMHTTRTGDQTCSKNRSPTGHPFSRGKRQNVLTSINSGFRHQNKNMFESASRTPICGDMSSNKENRVLALLPLPETVTLSLAFPDRETPSLAVNFSFEIPLIKGVKEAEAVKNRVLDDLGDEAYLGSDEKKEPGCVPQLVLKFTMKHRSNIQALEIIRDFSKIFTNIHESSYYYSVKIDQPSFFSEKLLNNMTLPISSVTFGTLIPCQEFISHWIINYDNEKHRCKEEFKSRFKIVFNFDEDKLVVIQIWTYNCNFKRNKGKGREFEYYTLTIERDQLQRMIVSHSSQDRISIFFELSYPIIICKDGIEIFPDKESEVKDPYYRIDAIYHGTSSDMKPEKGVQSDSRFIQVDFSESNLPIEQLYDLISRIYRRTSVSPEFANIPIKMDIIQMYQSQNHYHNFFYSQKTHPFDLNSYFGSRLREIFSAVKSEGNNHFEIVYYMYVLTSLGAYVKDQIFRRDDSYQKFCEKLLSLLSESYANTVLILKALITHLSVGGKNHAELFDILEEFHAASLTGTLQALPFDDNLSSHYEKVYVAVITPTRVIFKCPELHMGNTVTRDVKDNTRMLRILIRDEDGSLLREQAVGEKRFESLISDKMNGISICGRTFKFFGASGSQQREMGMYFMDNLLIEDICKSLGKYDSEPNKYKRLAREGQHLTQSIRCNVLITKEMVKVIPDFTSKCPETGKTYIFSDGCGCISRELWLEMCKDLKIDNPPCAFQFRYLGFKGMMTVNPNIEGRKVWFRNSQKKFDGRDFGCMEIVKYALPQPTNLSKPFINILCQNSSSNEVTHTRILNRLLDLYEEMFMNLAKALTDEDEFRKVLKELPYFLDIDLLSGKEGFILHQEPFFKSIIVSYVKQKLEQQIKKVSLPMPFHLGRSLFGVVDETGTLGPGQIFVQWSNTLKTKFNKTSSRTILTGKVTVTKNPCMASGDVRIFEALNSPQMAEKYWDVIVFPSGIYGGIRPHPDEMAGSDLDGDEYTVIYDNELLLDKNEEPFAYQAPKKTDTPTPKWKNFEEQQKEKRECMLKLLINNTIGVFSDAQLNNSEMYGISSQVCLNLIEKTTVSLDFAKSGIIPEKLTKNWRTLENGEVLPPEKAPRRADFKAKEDRGPTYASSRTNGIIHRSNRQLAFLLTTEWKEEKITMNVIFEKELKNSLSKINQEMEEKVLNEMNYYNSKLKGILNSYGIKTEGELFSGCILNMINKLGEREEDGSYLTAANAVERFTLDLFKEFREKFFEEFGGWREQTEYKGRREEYEGENVLNRSVKHVSAPMKLKALLCYKLAYEKAIQSGEQLLSFGWIAWDVLAKIQEKFNLSNKKFDVKKEGIFEKIRDEINYYKDKHRQKYEMLFDVNKYMPWLQTIVQTLYHNYGNPLFRVLFVLVEWAKKSELIRKDYTMTNGNIQIYKEDMSKFLLLIIYTAMGNDKRETLIEAFEQKDTREPLHEGELFMSLLKRLAMRHTIEVESVLERPIGDDIIELDWRRAHEAARKSYLALCIHQNVEEIIDTPAHMIHIEKETMVIELPTGINDEQVLQKLKSKTGALEMTLKRKDRMNPTFVTVLYRGNADVEEKLRRLVQLEAQKLLKIGPEMDHQMAKEVYENIMK